MWQSPWDNAVRGGDQVAQGLWGLATGAIGGTGVGLGNTRFVPEGHTDLVLAAVGEELGLVGLLVVGAAFALIAWRGFRIARRASSDYRFFLAVALTLSLAIPVLVMAAGILGLLPLTGVVTPFLSYGGSAMVANFVALGLLVGRRSRSGLARQRRPRAVSRARPLAGADGGSRCDGHVDRLRRRPDASRRRVSGPAAARACRPTAAAAFSTTRACSRRCAPFRAGPSSTRADCRWPRAMPAIMREAACRRRSRPSADACANPAERCYPAGPAFLTCSATRTLATTGARRTRRTSSAMPKICFADSTTARRRSRRPIATGQPVAGRPPRLFVGRAARPSPLGTGSSGRQGKS